MIDFKEKISEAISEATKIEKEELLRGVEIPKEEKQGDYAFPCFRLAKTLKKAPQIIAEEINSKIKFEDKIIYKTEIVGGYLNFFVNKETLAKTVIEEINLRKEDYRKI